MPNYDSQMVMTRLLGATMNTGGSCRILAKTALSNFKSRTTALTFVSSTFCMTMSPVADGRVPTKQERVLEFPAGLGTTSEMVV